MNQSIGIWQYEYSSGYPGYRCQKCASWVYGNEPHWCDCDKEDKTSPMVSPTPKTKVTISIPEIGMKRLKQQYLENPTKIKQEFKNAGFEIEEIIFPK